MIDQLKNRARLTVRQIRRYIAAHILVGMFGDLLLFLSPAKLDLYHR